MENFIISPDDCLILKAFKDSNSLREAATLLGCDPAGLTRRVQQISNQYGFLQKVNNRWQVTARGLDLVAWIDASMQSQKKILHSKSSLRIASTMWFSEELLIPKAPALLEIIGPNTGISFSVPNKSFELSLIDGSVDFVIVCHPPENPEIEHKQLIEEKWAVIAPISWQKDLKNLKGQNLLELLRKRPFIRHSEMNHDLFIPEMGELMESGISIDNLIGIRSAVHQGLGWSLVPRILVERFFKEAKLLDLPYDIPLRDRKVCIWWLRNRYEIKRQAVKVSSWLKHTLINFK